MGVSAQRAVVSLRQAAAPASHSFHQRQREPICFMPDLQSEICAWPVVSIDLALRKVDARRSGPVSTSATSIFRGFLHVAVPPVEVSPGSACHDLESF